MFFFNREHGDSGFESTGEVTFSTIKDDDDVQNSASCPNILDTEDIMANYSQFQDDQDQYLQPSQAAISSVIQEAENLEVGVFYEDNDSSPIEQETITKQSSLEAEKGPLKFEGFASASGKKVEISKETLAKVKNIFNNEDDNIRESESFQDLDEENGPTKFVGFASAAGKKVQISNEALAKVKNIFNDEDVNDKESKTETCQTSCAENGPTKFVGFASATGKRVDISKEALAKVKNIFNDEEVGDRSENNQTLDTENGPMKFVGFSSATGKKVDISKEALAKVRNIFNDEDVSDKKSKTETCPTINPENCPIKFAGFSSATGKKVDISKEALAKVKNMFNDEDVDDKESKSDTPQTLNAESGPIKFAGFSSATGKKVDISKEALAKVKNMFNDEDVDDKESKSDTPQTLNAEKGPMKFAGFSSASGKKVDISKEAFAKVRNTFNDEVVSDMESKSDTHQISSGPRKFVGFASATGKKVDISKEALAKLKQIFNEEAEKVEDLNVEKETRNCHPKMYSEESPKEFYGFASANGKTVAITSESLAAGKKSFNYEGEDVTDEKTDTPKSIGFASANGKRSNISSDSIKHAKNLFSDIETASENKENVSNNKKRKLEDNDMPEREEKKSCYHELLEDDFDIDTQALTELEQKAFGKIDQAYTPKQTKRMQSRLRIIGIPKVTDETIELRAIEREKQLKMIADKRNADIAHIGKHSYY